MLLRVGSAPDHGFDEPLGLLSDCHRRIEHFLSVLIALARKNRGGPLSSADAAALDGALRYFANAAPKHTADEEESLFPRLRQSADPDAHRALELVRRLEQDHDVADRHHQAVDELTRRWRIEGRLTAQEADALFDHLTALQTIYREHIQLEDHELFPAAARVLSAPDIDAIGREMAERRGAPLRWEGARSR